MTNSLRQQFGNKIRDLRKNRKLSQEALAEQANVHHTFIGAIERGEQAATVDTIEKIAAALQIQAKELFSFAPDPKDETYNSILSHLAGREQSSLQKILEVIKVIDR